MTSLRSTQNVEQCVQSIPLDLDIYSNIISDSERLKSKWEVYDHIDLRFRYIVADLYLALFKEEVQLDAPQLQDSHLVLQYSFVKKILDLDVFQALKNACTLSYFNAILGTELIADELIRQYKALGKRHKELKPNWASNTLNNQAFVDFLSDQHYFYNCIKEAQAEFNRMTYTIKAWGLDDGTLTPTSYEDKIAVSLKLRTNKKVQEIAEMTGRFKASASTAQKRRTKEEGIEIYNVHLGSELHKTLPSERMMLANKGTKRNFFKKLSQRELLSYKYKNSRMRSKGPIICCIDTSASMAGERETWSKAVALTLLELAYQQKRRFVAVLYSNKVYHIIEFSKKRREPNKIYDLATFFYGSGTNFIEPLRESLNLIRTAKYKYADIIFITDGRASIDDDFIHTFNQIKEKKEFRMITVNVADQLEEGLNKVNDVQILLKSFTTDEIEEANETLFSI